MQISFSFTPSHKITTANVNFYATPFTHPARTLIEHDFIYILEGEWGFQLGAEKYLAKKDTLLILGAGIPHRGVSPCAPKTKTMYFHVSADALDGADFGFLLQSEYTACGRGIKKLFSEIVQAFLAGNAKKADRLFQVLLCDLESLDIQGTDVADAIKHAIHANPERFLSNEELASSLNVSLKTAENKFRKKFGTGIHAYTLQFKMQEALSYFDLFPEISIKEVSANLGFYDEYHFSKQFKRFVGISPGQYKKQMKE
ncbi:MAG: helix-turn-helix domain-containing protein [Clostridia bacterium]|nr:helix-turn-helix domain-containing protein [Clostridia bacterium]